MSACPICGREDWHSDGTGYHGADICPECQALGWIETHTGEYVNEREDTGAEQFVAATDDPRRI